MYRATFRSTPSTAWTNASGQRMRPKTTRPPPSLHTRLTLPIFPPPFGFHCFTGTLHHAPVTLIKRMNTKHFFLALVFYTQLNTHSHTQTHSRSSCRPKKTTTITTTGLGRAMPVVRFAYVQCFSGRNKATAVALPEGGSAGVFVLPALLD